METTTASMIQDTLFDWTEDPLLSTILYLAEMMVDDPIRTKAYTDTFPDSVPGWGQLFTSRTILPFIWSVNGELAGFHWGHDLGVSATGQGYGWSGTYVLEAFRGRDWWPTRYAAYQEFIAVMNVHGISGIFGACRWENCVARRYTASIGFTSLGRYVDWASFEGQLNAVEVFTWRTEDKALAHDMATQRAEHVRQNHRHLSHVY